MVVGLSVGAGESFSAGGFVAGVRRVRVGEKSTIDSLRLVFMAQSPGGNGV